MLLLFALCSCAGHGASKCHLLSQPKLLMFRQGLGLRTPKPWVILPVCPHSLQCSPDFMGLFSCVIFTAWDKLPLSKERGRSSFS